MKGLIGRFGEKIQLAAENFSVTEDIERNSTMSATVFIAQSDNFGQFSERDE